MNYFLILSLSYLIIINTLLDYINHLSIRNIFYFYYILLELKLSLCNT